MEQFYRLTFDLNTVDQMRFNWTWNTWNIIASSHRSTHHIYSGLSLIYSWSNTSIKEKCSLNWQPKQGRFTFMISWKIIFTQQSLSSLRADCSNADKPGAVPQHNGLTTFGKVRSKDLTIGWQNLNLLSHPNATPAPLTRQARASGENLNYLALAPKAKQARPSGEILNYSLSRLSDILK